MRLHVRGINKDENIGRGHCDKSVSGARRHEPGPLLLAHPLLLSSVYRFTLSPSSRASYAFTSGCRRNESMTCTLLYLLLDTISWPSQAECVNPKTGHTWPKGVLCPSFHLCTSTTSRAFTADALGLLSHFWWLLFLACSCLSGAGRTVPPMGFNKLTLKSGCKWF